MLLCLTIQQHLFVSFALFCHLLLSVFVFSSLYFIFHLVFFARRKYNTRLFELLKHLIHGTPTYKVQCTHHESMYMQWKKLKGNTDISMQRHIWFYSKSIDKFCVTPIEHSIIKNICLLCCCYCFWCVCVLCERNLTMCVLCEYSALRKTYKACCLVSGCIVQFTVVISIFSSFIHIFIFTCLCCFIGYSRWFNGAVKVVILKLFFNHIPKRSYRFGFNIAACVYARFGDKFVFFSFTLSPKHRTERTAIRGMYAFVCDDAYKIRYTNSIFFLHRCCCSVNHNKFLRYAG